MGREVRRVPADWQHPKHWTRGLHGMEERYKPLFPGERYQPKVDEWDEECAKWKAGSLAHLDYCDCCAMEDAQEDGHDPAQRPALGCRSGANDRNPSAASSLGER